MKQRWKQLLSVLLTLAMLLGMVPGMTLDARADGDVAQIGDTGYQTLQAALDAATDGQTVQLIADVTENVTVDKADASIILDLAGYGITGGTTGGSVIKLVCGTLTITDSALTTGAHKYAITDGLAVLSEEGDRSFTGGYITGGMGTPDENYGDDGVTNGGGICVAEYACGFTIGKGAAIIGNQAAANETTDSLSSGFGGGVYFSTEGEYLVDGTDDEYAYYAFAIDGKISYNNAVKGGGVYTAQVNNTTISATIEYNTAENGGGVYDDGYEPVLQNSIIRYNSATTDGGGVYAEQGTLVIRDATKITDNTAGGNGGGVFLYWPDDNRKGASVALNGEGLRIKDNTGGNLYLSREKNVEPYRVFDHYKDDNFNEMFFRFALALHIGGSEKNIIGITLGTPDGAGQITGLFNDHDVESQEITNDTAESLLNSGYFFSDDSSLAVALTEDKNELQLIAPPHAHKLDGTAGEEGTVNFTKFSTLTPNNNKVYTIEPGEGKTVSYYLDADVAGRLVIQGPGTVNLCLNGHKIDANKTGSAITVQDGTTLNLCDCHSEAATDTHYYHVVDGLGVVQES